MKFRKIFSTGCIWPFGKQIKNNRVTVDSDTGKEAIKYFFHSKLVSHEYLTNWTYSTIICTHVTVALSYSPHSNIWKAESSGPKKSLCKKLKEVFNDNNNNNSNVLKITMIKVITVLKQPGVFLFVIFIGKP